MYMIYTVTLNPAIDVVLKLSDSCRVGKINRANRELIAIGGKGINVSRVLKALKRDSIALGLIGGYAGEIIEKDLKLEDIKSDFVRIKGGMTRINVKVQYRGSTFEETQINAPGPAIAREDIINLAKKLAKIKKGDIVIISGGMPKTISLNLFDSFLKFISSLNISPNEKNLNFCINSINGRYPESGYCSNLECENEEENPEVVGAHVRQEGESETGREAWIVPLCKKCNSSENKKSMELIWGTRLVHVKMAKSHDTVEKEEEDS